MSEANEEKVSALQENISRKGNNSYYYAHGTKINGPAWDGKEEPRLIAVESATETSRKLVTAFDSFSWLDSEKSVKIFVDFADALGVNDENIALVRLTGIFTNSTIRDFLFLISQIQIRA